MISLLLERVLRSGADTFMSLGRTLSLTTQQTYRRDLDRYVLPQFGAYLAIPFPVVTTTRLTRRIEAPRSDVYRALLDAEAVQRWMVPDDMSSEVHAFEACEGGEFWISLTYDAPSTAGKTTAQTDSFHGRFERLVRDTEVVQVVEFDTEDPFMSGQMRITYRLEDDDGGTELTAIHENLPPGVSRADNELGWSISIGKLADLVEGKRIDRA